jgi:hypothetical protein
MSLTQGEPLPDVTTKRSTATVAPDYYTDYMSDIAKAGQTAMAKPADSLIAPLTAMQQQGYSQVPAAADSYKPGLSAAQETVGQVAKGITPELMQGLMNPYTGGVVDEMARLQQQNIQRNVMPQLKAGFVGTGGLGGQRYANAMGQTTSDMQANLTGQQTGALQKGYADALQAALNQMQIQNQSAITQGNLAEKEQSLGLTGAGALTKAGSELQAFEQSKINAPLTNATNAAALLRGYTAPTTVTEDFKGPLAGAYSNSTLADIAGMSSLLGSAFNTPSGGGTPYGKEFIDWITKKLTGGTPPAGTPPAGTTTVDWSGGNTDSTPSTYYPPTNNNTFTGTINPNQGSSYTGNISSEPYNNDAAYTGVVEN